MHGRGVANDGGKGPEMGDEGDVHCLQKGLILSQTECLYIKDLVLNKDLFGILGPYLYFRVLIFTILVSFTQRKSIFSYLQALVPFYTVGKF